MKPSNGHVAYDIAVNIEDPDSDSNSSSDMTLTPRSSTLFARSPRIKFAIMAVFLFFSSFSNNVVMALMHDYVPQYPPLPDVVFGLFDEAKGLVKLTEFCISFTAFCSLGILMASSKRWLYATRIAYIASMLYIGRAICMCVTLLPVTSPSFACEAPNNHTTFTVMLKRIGRNFFALGFEGTGLSAACGDYIYSGHTVVTVLASLISSEYCPKKFRPSLPYFMYCLSATAVFGILITRLHYTIDVLIAYYLCTRLFWSYHTAVATRGLSQLPRRGDFISVVLWYPFLDFIENDY